MAENNPPPTLKLFYFFSNRLIRYIMYKNIERKLMAEKQFFFIQTEQLRDTFATNTKMIRRSTNYAPKLLLNFCRGIAILCRIIILFLKVVHPRA